MNRKLLLAPMLACAILAPAPKSAAAGMLVAKSGNDAAYVLGTKAMNDQRWSDAVLSFDQVINSKGKRADAALYWKAYSLKKLGKRQLAADACLQLHTQFKHSSWNEDCRILGLSLDAAQNHSTGSSNSDSLQHDLNGSEKDPDVQIKLLAIASVLNRNPEQAIPLLRDILTGHQSNKVKKQALSILAQSRSPEAQAMMGDLVLGKIDLDLQRPAIQDCGYFQGKRLNDVLIEAYRASTDVEVKRDVISALFNSGDDPRLVDLARQEKDLELKRTIVSQISLMNGKAATDYMMELLK